MVLLEQVAVVSALVPRVGRDDVEAADLYHEELSESEPIRAEQAREIDAYLSDLIDARPGLSDLWVPDYTSLCAYELSARTLRAALREAIGYPPPGADGRSAGIISLVAEDALCTYYRTKCPVVGGVHVVGLLMVPTSAALLRNGRRPLVVAMHGGGGSPEMATFHGVPNAYNDMVRGAVERGYVVWAPQHLFETEGFPTDIRVRLDVRARSIGTSLTALEVAKIARGLEALLAETGIDPDRVAMVGLSYGGYYTLYAAALVPQIGVAVSSCWFGDQVARLGGSEPFGWPDTRHPRGLALLRDPELVALICPKPLEVQVGQADHLFPVDEARACAPQARAHYQRLGVPERFRFVAFEGGHEFHGTSAWDWLARWL